MEEILHQLIGSLSQNLMDFIYKGFYISQVVGRISEPSTVTHQIPVVQLSEVSGALS